MSNRTRAEIADQLNEWHRMDQHIAELRRELAEEHEVIGIIARERTELRGVVADLNADCAALRTRLAASQAEARQLRAHRQVSVWGAVVALWWRIRRV